MMPGSIDVHKDVSVPQIIFGMLMTRKSREFPHGHLGLWSGSELVSNLGRVRAADISGLHLPECDRGANSDGCLVSLGPKNGL